MENIQLFNRDCEGGLEISQTIGFISDRVDFDVWQPILPLGIRDVVAIVGHEPVKVLADFYNDFCRPTPEHPASLSIPLARLQQAVALFTWLKIIPTLDAQHDTNGRQRRLGENERGLTALEQYKDESNIQRLAYEAVDALIEALDLGAYSFWLESPKCRRRAGLLIRDKAVFDEYYHIGSHRLFLTLTPILHEVQGGELRPRLGRKLLDNLLNEDNTAELFDLLDTARRALVLLTMKKAVERLPVEVLPEGVVQLNQSTPVKQRLRAEKEARAAVAASLGDDAARCLAQIEALVGELNNADEGRMTGPIVHSKGITF